MSGRYIRGRYYTKFHRVESELHKIHIRILILWNADNADLQTRITRILITSSRANAAYNYEVLLLHSSIPKDYYLCSGIRYSMPVRVEQHLLAG